MRFIINVSIVIFCTIFSVDAQKPVDYVNPFIGTSNYGTTNPGAVSPNGMMSVSPFNVMGSSINKYDKDKRWWSTPYTYENRYFTGFSHVNLSGVGCPDLGSLLLMATTGDLEVDYTKYGSLLEQEMAVPGYYSAKIKKYNILADVTASQRTALSRFKFPKGRGNIILNLGEGLTNESGATLRIVSDTEIEGSKLMGTFCYNSQAVFPIYFVMKISKKAKDIGYWKKQRPMGVEAQWDADAGKYKIYRNYTREMSGDDIGVWFELDNQEGEEVMVKLGVSFVSIENARMNMNTEQPDFNFDKVREATYDKWNEMLSRIKVEGGSRDNKIVFYTALYHLLIHPNIINDINGDYPMAKTLAKGNSNKNRYTVFSLWDTYRNVHPLLSLVYPEIQEDMVNSMIGIYDESGWLPKWELFGRETLTMDGDPASIVINDTWQRGIRGFDVDKALTAMLKSAFTSGKDNLLRQDNDDYMNRGYVALRSEFDHSVSNALEYYLADWNIAKFAKSLGYTENYIRLKNRALEYKQYYSKEYGCFRPILPNGKFLSPFNPLQGMNFEPVPGFHEGCAWNYAFFVPHDVYGLAKLMGGRKKFVKSLNNVFEKGYFDMTNEPDIAYPYLYSYFPKEAWRTQKLVKELLVKHFKNEAGGLPGNDDAGTMSAWAIYSMMGFYPACPGSLDYVVTSPTFDKITIKLNRKYYPKSELIIDTDRVGDKAIYIDKIYLGNKRYRGGFIINHNDLVNTGKLGLKLK